MRRQAGACDGQILAMLKWQSGSPRTCSSAQSAVNPSGSGCRVADAPELPDDQQCVTLLLTLSAPESL
jgi:hypothetical protein